MEGIPAEAIPSVPGRVRAQMWGSISFIGALVQTSDRFTDGERENGSHDLNMAHPFNPDPERRSETYIGRYSHVPWW